jgi:membrane protease subunit (stomatin/prohibitin family)
MVIDLIQNPDESAGEMVSRVPQSGSGEFRLGSQLVVRESQNAVFFRDGKALDVFGPGRHTISTNNIPFLTGLIGMLSGGKSIFTAEVYFVSMRELTDMKWGTPQPVAYRDADLGMVRLRAFGQYSMRVKDPQLFVTTVVGARGAYSTSSIDEYLRGIIVSEFNDLLGEAKTPLLDLGGLTNEMGATVRNSVGADFGRLGLELTTFQILAITPPEEVQKAIDQRSAMGALGNMSTYTQYQTANAIRDAANNPAGGAASTGAGLGAGMAMGQAMAQSYQNANQQPAQQPAAAPPAAGVNTTDVLAQLQKLNELKQAGALTEDEFNSMKAKIIGG